MSIPEEIARFENNWPRSFATVVERDYGWLFYDRDNLLSHDSNHAILFNLAGDLDASIADVCAFYEDVGVRPRFYHGFVAGASEFLLPRLQALGFKSAAFNEQYFIWTRPSEIKPVPGFELRRIQSMNQEVIDIIGPEDTWTLGVLKRLVARADCHLLVGYVDGVPVALAQFDLANGLSRVDGVTVQPKQRSKGYGHALMHMVVQYHREISSNVLYLYSSNPTAMRIYTDAGFTKLDWGPQKWSAWLPERAELNADQGLAVARKVGSP
jgi:GNAT superfamily N-acetyltransferase